MPVDQPDRTALVGYRDGQQVRVAREDLIDVLALQADSDRRDPKGNVFNFLHEQPPRCLLLRALYGSSIKFG